MNTSIPPRLLLCVVLLLSGCRTNAPTAEATTTTTTTTTLVRTELFFGLGRSGGSDVTEPEWRDFVDQQITPRFPDGLTILDASGQWRGKDGVIRHEPSRVLVLLHAPSAADNAKIDEIRRLYRERFAQESVLRVDDVQHVSF
jgi:hypothetical protein